MYEWELITILQSYPPDLRVMVDGHRVGLLDLRRPLVRRVPVRLDYHFSRPARHEYLECATVGPEFDELFTGRKTIDAVVISRYESREEVFDEEF